MKAKYLFPQSPFFEPSKQQCTTKPLLETSAFLNSFRIYILKIVCRKILWVHLLKGNSFRTQIADTMALPIVKFQLTFCTKVASSLNFFFLIYVFWMGFISFKSEWQLKVWVITLFCGNLEYYQWIEKNSLNVNNIKWLNTKKSFLLKLLFWKEFSSCKLGVGHTGHLFCNVEYKTEFYWLLFSRL